MIVLVNYLVMTEWSTMTIGKWSTMAKCERGNASMLGSYRIGRGNWSSMCQWSSNNWGSVCQWSDGDSCSNRDGWSNGDGWSS